MSPLLPRERLHAHGATALQDEELISLLIGSGVPNHPVQSISGQVLRYLDTTNGVVTPDGLNGIVGLGPAKIATLAAAFELARRVLCPERIKIRLPSDILPVVDRYVERKQEYFLTISLNGAHEVIATRVVTVGLVNRTMVHPREIFADLLGDRAAAAILAHNHPSGCVDPSDEDREVTRRAMEAGRVLGIPVLDHVIFSRRGYYSFLEDDAL